jgi:hypothetical protein
MTAARRWIGVQSLFIRRLLGVTIFSFILGEVIDII